MNNIYKILFVLIGGFIGAGFASGQEILIFFNKYGLGGFYGIIVSGFIFSITIYKVFSICLKYNINNYEDFLYELNFFSKFKPSIISIFKFIVNAFLLVSFYVMVAGFSSFFYLQFNIPILLTSSILCLVCYFLFNKNIESLINISTALIPLLILLICFIGIKQINFDIISFNYELTRGWLISSILYVSYNTILLVPLSISLKNYLKNSKNIIYCSILIGFIIVFLSLILFIILMNHNLSDSELPMLNIANNIDNIYKNIYCFVILSAIITTLLSSGFTFVYNFNNKYLKKNILIFIMCFSAIFISNFGFSNLVNILYPFFGYLGFLQIALILIK